MCIRDRGEEARLMLGRTPSNIIAVRPLKDGVISDYDITERMLKYFIRKTCGSGRFFKMCIRDRCSLSARPGPGSW